jgi:hypothetical protein
VTALDGQRRAAAGVAVELGEDEAGELSASWKALATFTASWPSAPSATSSTSSGWIFARSFLTSSIRSVSIWSRPAVSKMMHVGGGGLGGLHGGRADGGDILGVAVGVEAELLLLGEDLELVDGGGAVDVARDDEGPVAPSS